MGNILHLKQLVSFILLVGNLANGFRFIYQENKWSSNVVGSNNIERVHAKDLQTEIYNPNKNSFLSARETPPNAITDLRLTSIGSADPYDLIANLKWLAPASSPETPNTKVETYEIKYSENPDDLLSNFDSSPDAPLLNGLQTVPPGEEMNVDISFPNGLNTQFFIAVRAVGITGLKGELSNVASTVIIPTEPTPESTTTGTTIYLQPPDRITDLVLESSTGDEPMNLYSRLTWTAPSASPETPNATVDIYEIKYNETEQDLNDQFDNCLDVKLVNNVTIQPVPPGETITVDVFIDSGVSGSFFIAIRAIGTYGAKGEVSNIVKTIAKEPTTPITTTQPPISNSTESPAPPGTLSAGAIIGISIGGAALLCIITTLILCLYMNKKSKSKKKEDSIYQESNNLPVGGNSFPMNPPAFIPRPDYNQPTRLPPAQNYPAAANQNPYQQQSRYPY